MKQTCCPANKFNTRSNPLKLRTFTAKGLQTCWPDAQLYSSYGFFKSILGQVEFVGFVEGKDGRLFRKLAGKVRWG
jgi:hypothetical protein